MANFPENLQVVCLTEDFLQAEKILSEPVESEGMTPEEQEIVSSLKGQRWSSALIGR